MTFSSVNFSPFTNKVHIWEYDDAGIKQHIEETAPLYFFMKGEGEYTSIFGDQLKKVEFDSHQKMRETREMFKASGRQLFESDVETTNRIVLDRYSKTEIKNIPKYDTFFLDIEVHSEQGFPKPELAEHPITIITVYSTKQDKYFIFSEKEFDREFLPPNVWVKIFATEAELLTSFVSFIKKFHPDFLSGWNSSGFDIPYIVNRCYKIIGESETKKMSPLKYIREMKSKNKFGKEMQTYEIAGINCIDYLHLYRKYHQGEQESFKLGYIAKVELGETKLEFEGTLKELYHNDWNRYAKYNFQDVVLLVKLDKRIQFMDLMIGICLNCRVPFEQFDKTTKVLDGAFISRLSVDKIILPDVPPNDGNDQYAGAYVKDPVVGMHEWVMSFDATSLYPSVMIQHNISPETKVMVVHEQFVSIIGDALEGKSVDEQEMEQFATEDLKIKDVVAKIKENGWTIAGNGAIYRHDKKGVVASFVQEWFDKRKYHKKLMVKAQEEKNSDEEQLQKGLQHNYKILINSVYGYGGSKFSRIYDRDNALAVTVSGQAVLIAGMAALDLFFKTKWPTTDAGKKLNAVSIDSVILYGDTDSKYIAAGKVLNSINFKNTDEKTKAFLEKNIEPLFFKIINNAMEILTTKRMNCKECKIFFKREMIARRAIFLSKKHYAALVMKMEEKDIKEGDDHEIEAKGLEMVKSSTPEIIRDFMRAYILSLLKNPNEIASNDSIKQIYEKFKQAEFSKIAKITNVNNIAQYTGNDSLPIKGSPGHVKATIAYNNLLAYKGIENDYEPIYEGDKVKLVYLINNNPYNLDAIAFKEKLPKEFGLDAFVDYDIMWSKVFFEPIRQFYEVLRWQMPQFDQENIDDLFG
jgi:DNA polymerase elongation subunit (family B)